MADPTRRLVPRYLPIGRVEVTWTPAGQAKLFKGRPKPVTATILDVSVTGMLVDLPLEPKTDPGDIVALSWDGNRAVARVGHTNRNEELAHQLVGVEITEMSPDFAANLNAAVAAPRGDQGQLAELWHGRSAP